MKLLRTCVAHQFERTALYFLGGLILATLFAVVEGPWDPVADWHRLTGQYPVPLRAAQWVSRWGDFWPGGLLLCLFLFIVGLLGHWPQVRRAALTALCAALLAGSVTMVLKSVLGRARPIVAQTLQIDDGFHGPHWTSGFASFPSGHTTTAFAVATALAILLPRIGWPVLGLAALVGWSRMYVGAHYFGDVVAGMWIGSYAGWLLASATRKRLEWSESHDLTTGTKS